MKFNKYKVFMVLYIIALIILSIYSFLFNELGLVVIFLILIYITSIIFSLFTKINLKLYFLVAILMLPLGSLIYAFLSQNYNLINDKNLIFPILAGITFALGITVEMRKQKLIREALHLIGLNKYDESLKNIDKMQKFYPEDYAGIYLKAMVFGKLEKYQEQLELSDIILTKNKIDLYAPKAKLDEKSLVALNIKIDAFLNLKNMMKLKNSLIKY